MTRKLGLFNGIFLVFHTFNFLIGITAGEETCNLSDEIATYEEVKGIINHPEKYLIDVRNPDELVKTGTIPASINIPFGELESALRLSNDAFNNKYGRAKPKKDAIVIFSCHSGKRASAATGLAKHLGYVNAKPYPGSWLEWTDRGGN